MHERPSRRVAGVGDKTIRVDAALTEICQIIAESVKRKNWSVEVAVEPNAVTSSVTVSRDLRDRAFAREPGSNGQPVLNPNDLDLCVSATTPLCDKRPDNLFDHPCVNLEISMSTEVDKSYQRSSQGHLLVPRTYASMTMTVSSGGPFWRSEDFYWNASGARINIGNLFKISRLPLAADEVALLRRAHSILGRLEEQGPPSGIPDRPTARLASGHFSRAKDHIAELLQLPELRDKAEPFEVDQLGQAKVVLEAWEVRTGPGRQR